MIHDLALASRWPCGPSHHAVHQIFRCSTPACLVPGKEPYRPLGPDKPDAEQRTAREPQNSQADPYRPPRPSRATSRDFQTHDVHAHAPPPHSPSLYCFRPPRTRVLTLSAVLHAVMKLLRLCLSNKMATAYVPNDISTARFAHMNTQLVSFILHRSSIEWYVDGRVKRKLVQSLVHTSCAITMFSVESAVYYPLPKCCNCGYLGTARSQQLDGV